MQWLAGTWGHGDMLLLQGAKLRVLVAGTGSHCLGQGHLSGSHPTVEHHPPARARRGTECPLLWENVFPIGRILNVLTTKSWAFHG